MYQSDKFIDSPKIATSTQIQPITKVVRDQRDFPGKWTYSPSYAGPDKWLEDYLKEDTLKVEYAQSLPNKILESPID